VLYIVTRSLSEGRLSGLVSVLGVALGNLGNALGASVGLAALFALWSTAFTLVKYAGALYLIILGIQVLRRSAEAIAPAPAAAKRLGRVFRDGFFVALFNPKTALFFAAFLPQFLGRAGHSMMVESLVLGTLFVLIAASTDTLYAVSAGWLAPRLAKAARGLSIGRYATAGAFVGLGLYTALGGTKPPQS
jgi:threonine/homoserine/homoserine lactone efflux protein